MLVKLSVGLICEAFDLGVLATRDSSLISSYFAFKVHILERK
jgi:hypothetical protein